MSDKSIPKSISLYPEEWEEWEKISQQNGGRSAAARHLLEVAKTLEITEETLAKVNHVLVAEIGGKITAKEALERIQMLALMHSPKDRIYAPRS